MIDGRVGSRRRRSDASRVAHPVGVPLAVLTYLLFPASPAVDFPVYEIGSVASDNVIAPFAFRVLKTPDELEAEQAAAVRGVEPVFDFVPAALDTARRALDSFGAAIASAAGAADGRRPRSPRPCSAPRRAGACR